MAEQTRREERAERRNTAFAVSEEMASKWHDPKVPTWNCYVDKKFGIGNGERCPD